MAREIIVWCDVHMERHDERVAGDAHEFVVDGQTLALDLCPDCFKELAGPITELQDLAQPQPRKKKGKGKGQTSPSKATFEPVECPQRGCTEKLSSRPQAKEHFTQAHKRSLATYERGREETVFGEKLKHFCPTCGEGFTTPQGLGAHRSKRHDYRTGDDNQ